MVINEAASNIRIHAGATESKFVFKKTGEKVLISIIDNGKGFDEIDLLNGIGFSNMKNRINELNGEFRFKSVKNKGTEIAIALDIL